MQTNQKHLARYRDVMHHVKQGLNITEACKMAKVSKTTLYSNMDQKEKRILDAAKVIARPVRNMKGLRGIAFFLEREDLYAN